MIYKETSESAARFRSAARYMISPLLGTGSSAANYMIITTHTDSSNFSHNSNRLHYNSYILQSTNKPHKHYRLQSLTSVTINTNCITCNTYCSHIITSNTNCSHISHHKYQLQSHQLLAIPIAVTSVTSNTNCSHNITSQYRLQSHQSLAIPTAYHKYRLQSHQSLTIPSLFTSATSNTDCIKSNTDCITSNTDCITSNTECTTSNTECITSNIYCSHIINNNTDSRHISHQKYQLQSHQ
ncbi:hypothetical protein DPMN_151523 [Dreissena polymorpha]|uniref:Uncharacterized protein n=1 Tax=Dreissena polymorpha TaxID=45954 RepID=A0A9D4FFH1_DREPO|nr:hypothetical protein DPMN_151523 [Dreissena polymorpha]